VSSAIHHVTQEALPVLVVATGVHVLARAGDAKSYAESLFDYRSIGALSTEEAREALIVPAMNKSIVFEDDAAIAIMMRHEGTVLSPRVSVRGLERSAGTYDHRCRCSGGGGYAFGSSTTGFRRSI
jgi:hypothetical protein